MVGTGRTAPSRRRRLGSRRGGSSSRVALMAAAAVVLMVFAAVSVGCGNGDTAGRPTLVTGSTENDTSAVSDAPTGPADHAAARHDIEIAKANLQRALEDPIASSVFPGLDNLEQQVGPVDEWVYIAGAEMEDPATQGTLLVTETGLHFADLSGAPVVSFLVANILSVTSEDLSVTVEISGQDVQLDASLLHVNSSGAEANFMVDRAAAADLKAILALLRSLAGLS